MAQIVYNAVYHTEEVSYTNLNGESRIAELKFLMHPMTLLSVFADIPDRKIKSGNPSLNGKSADISESQQIKLVQDLAGRAAGIPSSDGESWIPFENFEKHVSGHAFLTKLATSEKVRKDFSDKVILAPFRAFVGYAEADPSNSPKEVKDLKDTLTKMENTFKVADPSNETPEELKAKLQAQLAALDERTVNGGTIQGTVVE